MAQWQAPQVAVWLQSIGLSRFQQQFVENEVTGDVLPMLGVEELREMGITLIGPRTYLVKCLKKLKLAYLQMKRNEVKWQGSEQKYTCFIPCDCACDYALSCCLPDPPDQYTLTGSSFKVKTTIYPCGKICRCFARGSKLHTIDLSNVKDVDASSAQNCCSGHDLVYITQDASQTTLKLKLKSAPGVVKMLRDGVEESQSPDAGRAL